MQEYKAAKLNSRNFNFASQALLPSPHTHAVQAGSLLQDLTFTLRRTSSETPVDFTQYVITEIPLSSSVHLVTSNFQSPELCNGTRV